MYYDLSYLIFMLPAILLTLWAQFKVKSAYSEYSQIANSRSITGEDAACAVLAANGVANVKIEHISGTMTDHFSPRENVIRLSDGVQKSTSVAAVCIAADRSAVHLKPAAVHINAGFTAFDSAAFHYECVVRADNDHIGIVCAGPAAAF